MADFSTLGIIKRQMKAYKKEQGCTLSQAQKAVANELGFDSFFQLQKMFEANREHPKLMRAAFGYRSFEDAQEVLFSERLYGTFMLFVDEALSSKTADTNAFEFLIENVEVEDRTYDDETGVLSLILAFEYNGEQDPDRPFVGDSFSVKGIINLAFRDGAWSFSTSKEAPGIECSADPFDADGF